LLRGPDPSERRWIAERRHLRTGVKAEVEDRVAIVGQDESTPLRVLSPEALCVESEAREVSPIQRTGRRQALEKPDLLPDGPIQRVGRTGGGFVERPLKRTLLRRREQEEHDHGEQE
jgi:hypothetical protein